MVVVSNDFLFNMISMLEIGWFIEQLIQFVYNRINIVDVWGNIGGYIRRPIEIIITSGIVIFVIKAWITSGFDAILETRKKNYKKEIMNFDRYFKKKHEIYGELMEILYGSGLASNGLYRYGGQMINFYDTYSEDEMKEEIRKIEGIRYSENDLDDLIKMKKTDRTNFGREVLRFRNAGETNLLYEKYTKFRSLWLKSQLYFNDQSLELLKNIDNEFHQLLLTYNMKDSKSYESEWNEFMKDKEKHIGNLEELLPRLVYNLKVEIEDNRKYS